MASKEKHKKRSCRSYISNQSILANHAKTSISKAAQKQQKKGIFDGIKKLFTGAFKKNKEG